MCYFCVKKQVVMRRASIIRAHTIQKSKKATIIIYTTYYINEYIYIYYIIIDTYSIIYKYIYLNNK